MIYKSISCQNKTFYAEINLPASKSISNRVLIISALSKNNFDIINLSEAHDTQLMHRLLNQISQVNTNDITTQIDAEDAGTVLRFLTALLSRMPGNWLLTGSPKMQTRPIGILVDALRELGANIEYEANTGFPPLKIKGSNIRSKPLKINANVSSQFISALLLIAPVLNHGLSLQFDQKPSSEPYIKMTLELMQHYGITTSYGGLQINVQQGHYQEKDIVVEADWSAAAFWYQLVAFSEKGKLLLKGLKPKSLQGDSIMADIFQSLGVSTKEVAQGVIIEKTKSIAHHINLDFSHYPDIAMPVIATCAGLGIIGRFTGLESLKIKESNRVQVLEQELGKLGFDFRETDEHEWVLINSCKVTKHEYDFSNILINTYNDHRVAMSFAPFAMLGKGIQIEKPNVVRKSYPNYWNELEKVLNQS